VAYRDNSHEKSFNALRSHRDELYLRTGIQHQPFNTIYQLAARKAEQPELIHQDTRWLLLPDLMGFLVTRQANYELTESSTTQLMGLDNTWSVEAFELAGWPVPDLQPSLPGHVGGYICDRVRLMEVGSHDTASAVFGLGPYSDGQVFLNIGTWSLLGRVVSNPIVNPEAQAANFTNERCVDGKVRFLKNVPGFWVMNRLHDELGISQSIPEWIESANLSVSERLDLESPALFSPDSMLAACAEQLKRQDFEPSVWSGICVNSLADCIAQNVSLLGRITGPLSEIKVGGGASKSDLILAQLAEKTGMKITRSHPEATLVGNLRYQLSVSSKRRS
jgi:rhamnulokinase